MIGTFLIIALILVLCCACQGQTKKESRRYDLVEQDSNNSLTGGGKNMSNASTNTLETPCKTVITEESSIGMSDEQSLSTKQSDLDPHSNLYLPPPTLYDCPQNTYKIYPNTNQHQNRPNPLYEMSRSQMTESVISEELPLPPPPPPHRTTPLQYRGGEQENVFRGFNPTFKTFLDKTIAIKSPQLARSNNGQPLRHAHSSLRYEGEGEIPERKGLITSAL